MPSSTPLPAPEVRAGCGTFLLVMIAGLGVIIGSAGAVFALVTPEELPDQRPWDIYLAAALLWAVAAGVAAVVSAFAPSTARGSTPGRRVALLDAAMALAVFWPLEAALSVLYLATRPGLRRGIRPAAAAVSVVTLVAGTWWGVTAYDGAQPRQDTHVSRDALVGGWRTSDGGLLVLAADGRYSATQVPKELFTGDWDSQARVDAAGEWDFDGSFGFTDGGADGGIHVHLSVYRTRSVRMLCIVEDPDTACGSGLTFLPVPGPAAAAR
jgi:hypothetical protein